MEHIGDLNNHFVIIHHCFRQHDYSGSLQLHPFVVIVFKFELNTQIQYVV